MCVYVCVNDDFIFEFVTCDIIYVLYISKPSKSHASSHHFITFFFNKISF